MKQLRVWLWIALLSGWLTAAAAAQPTCDLTDAAAHPRLDADAFFALPRGSLALAGTCDQGNNLCQAYIDVSRCSHVRYPLATSGRANTLFVAINTVSTCREDCDLLDTFLSAALLFDHADSSDAVAPFADLTRNASTRWGAYRGAALARQACCDGVISPELFVGAQAAGAPEADFLRRTGKHWHSIFEHLVRRNVLTWSYRDFFTAALGRCGDGCSTKSYLLRFQERSVTEGARPGSPVLFSANLMRFGAVRLLTMAPFGGETYEHDIAIELLR